MAKDTPAKTPQEHDPGLPSTEQTIPTPTPPEVKESGKEQREEAEIEKGPKR